MISSLRILDDAFGFSTMFGCECGLVFRVDFLPNYCPGCGKKGVQMFVVEKRKDGLTVKLLSGSSTLKRSERWSGL